MTTGWQKTAGRTGHGSYVLSFKFDPSWRREPQCNSQCNSFHPRPFRPMKQGISGPTGTIHHRTRGSNPPVLAINDRTVENGQK